MTPNAFKKILTLMTRAKTKVIGIALFDVCVCVKTITNS